jgi:uncharacterized coiled-coil DUF342 family protein
MILWWASLEGPRATPGQYKVSLSIEDSLKSSIFEMTKPFTVLADPRAESTLADMQKQFTFIKDVNKTMDDAHKSIKKIRAVNKQLGAFQVQYKDDDNVKVLVEKAKALEEQLSTIEKELYQTKNRSGQDPLNFPIKLTNKLGHLNSLVSMGDFAPTEQDIAVKNELSGQIKKHLDAFNTILNDEVKAFNTAFNAKQLNYLFVED